jgi:hypothetical protein
VSLSRLVREGIIPHNQGGQSIGEGIDTGARLSVSALVRPYYIKAGVDARDGESVEG